MKKEYISPETILSNIAIESQLLSDSQTRSGVTKASWGVNENTEHSNADWFNEGYQDGDTPVPGGDDWGTIPSTAKGNQGDAWDDWSE